jgi:DNA polymerase III epsilon subunit-like protein
VFIVIGVEAVQDPSKHVHVLEVAAVAVDPAGREAAAFESIVNPGGFEIPQDVLERTGLLRKDIQGAPDPGNAADKLRTFLGAYPEARIMAYNLDRAKRLLSIDPWKVASWGDCIREKLLMRTGVGDSEEVKLYDAAQLYKIPVAVTRRALSDARISVEIIGKMERRMHNVSEADFLREAEYIMENGL